MTFSLQSFRRRQCKTRQANLLRSDHFRYLPSMYYWKRCERTKRALNGCALCRPFASSPLSGLCLTVAFVAEENLSYLDGEVQMAGEISCWNDR